MSDNGKAIIAGVAVGVVGVVGSAVAWCCGKSKGHAKGVADGYVKASNEYEQKLLDQANQFLREKNCLANSAAEKDRLIQELVALLKQETDMRRKMEIQMTLSRVRAA